MNLRSTLLTVLLVAAMALTSDRASADPVRRALHLQTLSGIRQAAARIPDATFSPGARATFLQQLDSVMTSIQQDQFAAAANTLQNNVIPGIDGEAPPDILPLSRSKTNLRVALQELRLVLSSEATLAAAGQSNTKISENAGVLTYRRLNAGNTTSAATALLGGQFFPYWRGFTEPDPDGVCREAGNDSVAGCKADPAVVNGDNQRTLAFDDLGTPARAVPWSYEFKLNPDGTPEALTWPWSTYLDSSDRNKANFVRIFSSYFSIPQLGGNFFPWQVQNGLNQVQNGICQDQWDERALTSKQGYFDRFRALIAGADAHGVVVQVSLFVRQEIDPGLIELGTWAKTNSDVAAGATFTCPDGLTYAMPREIGADSATRNFFTVEDGSGLTPVGRTERVFIRKLVREALSPSADVPTGFTNVVFEVMNEPISDRLRAQYPSQDILIAWQSFVIRTIRETEAELRQQFPTLPSSVLSVNAVPSKRNSASFSNMDVIEWREDLNASPGDPVLGALNEVGLINYHGYFEPNVLAEDLSLDGLNGRLDAHITAFGAPGSPNAIAALISTDGMRIGGNDGVAFAPNQPLASVAETTSCSGLASSKNANNTTVNLGRSNCRIAPNIGPCSPDAPMAPIGDECATAHGIPGLLRVFRTGYRNEVVSGTLAGHSFTLQNFIEDVARRVVTGAGNRTDPPSTPVYPAVSRVPGAYHFHNQSPFEDALEDIAQVPRPAAPAVPLDGAVALLALGIGLGRAMTKKSSR